MTYFEFLSEDGIINAETLLDHALFCINFDEEFENTLAHDILVSYVMYQHEKEEKEYTVDEVFSECETLLMNHVNAKMVAEGLLEPDFSGEELTYNLTETGKERLEREKHEAEDNSSKSE